MSLASILGIHKGSPTWPRYLTVFGAAVALSASVQPWGIFRDPDTFYHLQMARLMADGGTVLLFPWLPFTTLAQSYADQHLAYHWLLVPFVSLLGDAGGMYVAGAVFYAVAVTAFFHLLRVHAVRWPEAYTAILGTSAAFLFRMNLGKAGPLAVALLLLGLACFRQRRTFPLFLIGLAYAWTHGGWPLYVGILSLAAAAQMISDRFGSPREWFASSWRERAGGMARRIGERLGLVRVRPAAASLAGAGVVGVVTGLVANPYFPGNASFYWEQIVQIGLLGPRSGVGVGLEWYPYNPADLVGELGGPFVLMLGAFAVTAFSMFWPDVQRREVTDSTTASRGMEATAWICAAILLAATLRSIRFVEYLAPFAVFAAALTIDRVARGLDVPAAKLRLASVLPRGEVGMRLLASWFAAAFLLLAVKDAILIRTSLAKGFPISRFAGAGQWLQANAMPGDIVLHGDWDDFPPLFLHAPSVRYVVGLDPVFLFRRDPDRYRLWRDIASGSVAAGAAAAAKSGFAAAFAFVENDHVAMLKAFEADSQAIRVYQDAEATVFRLP